jgi:hypothetical protein
MIFEELKMSAIKRRRSASAGEDGVRVGSHNSKERTYADSGTVKR